MTLHRVSSSYALELTAGDFCLLLKLEEAELYAQIEGIQGVDSVEWSGHFGPYIFYTVDAGQDSEATHACVASLVGAWTQDAREASHG